MRSTSRDIAIDCVGGVMIIAVIVQHCLLFNPVLASSWIGRLFYYGLGICMMPWFFFKGGMFFSKEPLSITLFKGTVRLIVPYLTISFLSVIVMCAASGLIEGWDGICNILNSIPKYIKSEGAVIVNPALWFLPSLFFTRVFFNFSLHLGIPSLITLLFSLSAAFLLHTLHLPIGLYFENIALGLVFFSAGNLMSDKQYNDFVFYLTSLFYIVFICYCFLSNTVSGAFNNNSFNPFLPVMAFAFTGCCFINNLFHRFTSLQFSFLFKIGKSSMVYYIFHFLIIGLVVYLNRLILQLNSHLLSIVLVGTLSIMLPLLSRLFSLPTLNMLIGEKRVSPPAWVLSINKTFSALIVGAIAVTMIFYEFVIGLHL